MVLTLLLFFQISHGEAKYEGLANLPFSYYHVSNWRVENPIGKTIIGDVFINSDDTLFVATSQGIKSFDGHSFSDTFNYNTKINSYTLARLEGSQLLWGINQFGLFRFNETGHKNYSTDISSFYYNLYNQFTLNDESPWLIIKSKLNSLVDNKLVEFNLPFDPIIVANSNEGDLIVGFEGGFALVDTFGQLIKRVNFDDKKILPRAILATSSGVIWIHTNKGSYQYKLNKLHELKLFDHIPTIRNFFEDSKHNIWIATLAGIYVFKDNVLNQVNIKDNTALRIRGIAEDRSGNIWFGTWGKGLFRLKTTPFEVYETNVNPRAYLQAKDGSEWLGGFLGLTVNQFGKKRKIEVPDLIKGSVSDIEEGINGDIWVSFKYNLVKFSNNKFNSIAQTITNRIFRFIVKHNDNLWVGTDAGLFVKNLQEDTPFRLFELPNDEVISTIIKIHDSKLLFTTNKQSYIYNHGLLETNEIAQTAIPKNLVLSFDFKTLSLWYYDLESNAIIQHNGTNSKTYSLDNILRNLSFYSLEFTNDHNLILFGESGVIRIRDEWLKNYQKGKPLFYEILPIPGTENSECNSGYKAVILDKNKDLKFSCKQALITLHEERTTLYQDIKPQAVVQKINIQNIGYNHNTKNLTLPPDTHSFQFNFTSNFLNQLSPLEFRYKLHGLNDYWTYTYDLYSATYAELRPGPYRFEVQVRNSQSTWQSSTEGEFEFSVTNYFYQRPWFILFSILIVTLTFIFYGVFKSSRHRKLNLKLTELVKEKTKELTTIQARELKFQQNSTANLAIEVEKRTQELQQQMLLTIEKDKQLREAQKMEAVGQLTSGIAHDFNNMLSVIFIGAEVIKKDLIKQNSSQSRNLEWLNTVLLTAENCKDVIGQLIQFTQKGKNNNTIFNASEALISIIQLLRIGIPETMNFETSISSDDSFIEADISQFNQVILNLIINARNACEDYGEIVISSQLVYMNKNSTCASCQHTIKGEFVEIAIKDSGVGITKEIIPHIFTPFFRKNEKQEGTGIGLHIVHSNLHKMNGHILVESTRVFGTEFKVLIPLTKKTKPTVKTIVETPPQTRKFSKPILFVEDSESLIDLISWIMEEEEIPFNVAKNGQEGLELFYKDPDKYALILTDNSMPKMKGIDMSKEILSTHPQSKIILLTGDATEKTLQESKAIGIKEVYLKPIKSEELIRLIQSYNT